MFFIFLVGFIVFSPTLRVGFMWDDHEMIEHNSYVQSWTFSNLKHAFQTDVFEGKGDSYYRPVQTLTNMLDYSVWGNNPFGFHLTNLLIHIFNAILLFLILGRMELTKPLALPTSLMFVVHPIIVEQLLIIAGRAELLSVFFIFLSILLSLKNSFLYWTGACVTYFLACLSKESGVVFPALLILIGTVDGIKKHPWKKIIIFSIPLAAYLILRMNAVSTHLASLKNILLSFFQEFPTIMVHYVGTILFPTDLHSHRRMAFHRFWMGTAPLFILCVAALAYLRKSKLLLLALGWFFIGFLTKIPLFASNSLMLDHWAYLSAIGIFLGLAGALRGLAQIDKNGKKAAMALLTIVLSFWAALAYSNIEKRNTDKKLLQWALRFPSSSIVRCNLGLVYYMENNYSEAEPLLRQSMEMNPNPAAVNGLALTLWKTNRSGEALALLDESIAHYPNFASLYVNRGLIRGGREGIQDFEKALELEPANPLAQQLLKHAR